MRLSIHVLMDELKQYEPVLLCQDNAKPLDIKGFRLLGSGYPEWDPELVYITDANYFSFIPKLNVACTFIVIGDFNDTNLVSSNHSLLVIKNDISLIELSNKLNEIFEHFNGWEEDLHTALLQDVPLQELLEIGCRVLENPLCLTDTTKAVLVMAGTIPSSIEGSIFEVQLREGRTPPEVLPTDARKYIDSRVMNNSDPVFLEVKEKKRLATWVICGIFAQNRLFGTLATSDVSAEITLGQSFLFNYLKKIVEKSVARLQVSASGEEGLHFVTEQILHGLAINRTVIDYHLSQHGWDSQSSYRLICVAPAGENTQFNEISDKYITLIKGVYPHAFYCQYEHKILVIDRKKKADEHSNDFSKLLELLEEQNLRVGISMVFNSFMYLKNAFVQCNLALDNSAGQRICSFISAYQTCFLSSFKQVASLNSFCHPRILHMCLHGDDRDRDYIRCLKSYLVNGCNLAATAKKLHLHRNTLDYRLEQVGEELSIDFKTLTDDTLLLLILSCEIAESLANEDKDTTTLDQNQEIVSEAASLEHINQSGLEVFPTIMKTYSS